MKLLISVVDESEAIDAVKGGADIVDVKNPAEGSLGAPIPSIIKAVRSVVPSRIEVSAAIGDLPDLPGTAALAALGAASCGVDYVKAGLFGTSSVEGAVKLATEVREAVDSINSRIKVVAAGYADYREVGSLNPLRLPEVAHKAGAEVVMIDVKEKRRGKLFDLLPAHQLVDFVREAHDSGLSVALAGSLDFEDIKTVFELGADVIGFRGAVCANRDRVGGRLDAKSVARLADAIAKLAR